jgi:acyl carrier protein
MNSEAVTARKAALASVITNVLGREHIEFSDNFWDNGLHSLLAARLTTEIKGAFNIELDIGTIFHNPTVEDLARIIWKDKEDGS